ncbi:MAG: hypothetical protein ACRENE_20140 [Polyangiaceae bacterium]
MGRKTTLEWGRARALLLLGTWIAAALVVQGAAGAEIGRSTERRELRLRGREVGVPACPATTPAVKERSRDDTLQPWERVAS